MLRLLLVRQSTKLFGFWDTWLSKECHFLWMTGSDDQPPFLSTRKSWQSWEQEKTWRLFEWHRVWYFASNSFLSLHCPPQIYLKVVFSLLAVWSLEFCTRRPNLLNLLRQTKHFWYWERCFRCTLGLEISLVKAAWKRGRTQQLGVVFACFCCVTVDVLLGVNCSASVGPMCKSNRRACEGVETMLQNSSQSRQEKGNQKDTKGFPWLS